MSAAKLKMIETELDHIERSAEECDHPGGAVALSGILPRSLREWDSRIQFFDHITSELISVSRATQTDEVLSTTKALHSKARKAEHMLNVVLNDLAMPPRETDASIRYVVEDEELLSNTLVQQALVKLALRGPHQIRRLAWFNICRRFPQPLPLAEAGSGHERWGGDELRSLRDELIGKRSSLGPRGTMLEASEASDGYAAKIPELLAVMASSPPEDRNEAAVTLGEIGGEDVAIFLADALQAQLERDGYDDEDYQVYLVSALSNLGGPKAIEGLLQATEKGSERVRLAALSSLEFLATAGSIALTEAPEPAVIENAKMRDAYINLTERLTRLISSGSTPPYVRYKAGELLDTLETSLEHARVPA